MTWRACGDRAALWEARDLDEVIALHSVLDAERKSGALEGVIDLVPAARTLLVRCESSAALVRAIDRIDVVRSTATPPADESTGAEIVVAVHYDGEDLGEVADLLGLSRDEVVRRHTATGWRAAFTGFAPGFAYLVPDDPTAWQVPRRAEPRTSVPAGAVALAGGFGGVYPRASPGGWQLIGHTDLVLWDLARTPPALVAAGDRVRFEIARGTR